MILAAVRAYESSNPQVFGNKGAGSRVFALVETAFTLGMMLGPLISGSVVAMVGYFYMNVVLGMNNPSPIITSRVVLTLGVRDPMRRIVSYFFLLPRKT